MANNRMFIKCLKCNELKMLAKYYPSSGWHMECLPKKPKQYRINAINMAEQLERCQDDANQGGQNALNEWLSDHRHEDFSAEGPTHYVIEFE